MLSIHSVINFALLLLLGVYEGAAFSGIELNKKNIIILSIFSLVIGISQAITFFGNDLDFTMQIYPLQVHLPLALLMIIFYRRKPVCTIASITTVYMFCQLSRWVGLLAQEIFASELAFYIARSIALVLIGVFLLWYMAPVVSFLFSKPAKSVIIFAMLPIIYYVLSYAMTVYTSLLYSGSPIVTEMLPLLFCIAYMIFLVVYVREYEAKSEIDRQRQLVQIQATQAAREVEAIRNSEHEILMIRHDMRHYLANVLLYIQTGNDEKAISYIKDVSEIINETVVDRYCENALINSVLSYYRGIMDKQRIWFECKVELPGEFACSEIELSSILSNGLENAINAVSGLSANRKEIKLWLRVENNKMLLSIKNPYETAPVMVDGMPISGKEGHGLGTQSIRFMTERLNGNCQFVAENGIFTLRVVL